MEDAGVEANMPVWPPQAVTAVGRAVPRRTLTRRTLHILLKVGPPGDAEIGCAAALVRQGGLARSGRPAFGAMSVNTAVADK